MMWALRELTREVLLEMAVKDYKGLMKWLKDSGLEVEHGGRHITARVRGLDRAQMEKLSTADRITLARGVTIPSTPSDSARGALNARADLRRYLGLAQSLGLWSGELP